MYNYFDLNNLSHLWDKIVNKIKSSIVQSDWAETDTSSDAFIKNKPDIKEVSVLLTASGWVGTSAPFTNTVTVDVMSNYTNCVVEISSSATSEQILTLKNADVSNVEYSNGTIIFTANGEKPNVNIPINLVFGFAMNATEVPVFVENGTQIEDHTHDDRYYTESEIDIKLNEKAPLNSPSLTGIPVAPTAASGTNTTQIATTAFAQTEISAHNTSSIAHSDIRELISELTTRLNAIADSDDVTLDQFSEIVAYIKANRTLIESVTTSKVSVSDIIDNLTSTSTDKPLSANQGKILNDLISALQTAVDAKVSGIKGDAETSYRTGSVNITPTNIGLGNVPNVSTNDQTPTYTEATTLSALSTGEKLSVAFGKISKAVSDLISHLLDTVSHITSTERTLWNTVSDKVDKVNGKGLSTEDYTTTEKEKLGGLDGALLNKLGESTEGTLTFNGSEIKTNTDYVANTKEEAQAAIDAGLVEEGASIYVKEDSDSIQVMTGATADVNGSVGMVPQPLAGQQDYVLTGDGTWKKQSSNGGISSDFITKTTIFNDDGSIVEIDADNNVKTIVFNDDSSIVETITDVAGSVVAVKTTIFNDDGSITETVV